VSTTNEKIDMIVVGSSTGGAEALNVLLPELPSNFRQPILVSQHMPDTFIDEFVIRLNKLAVLVVKQAKEGDELKAGTVYVSSGKKTIIVRKRNKKLFVTYTGCDGESGFCPSIDETLKSLVRIKGVNVLSIILSGIGKDGVAGVKELKKMGSKVWAQAEKDCIAFGMPKAIIDEGFADKVIHPSNMAEELMRL